MCVSDWAYTEVVRPSEGRRDRQICSTSTNFFVCEFDPIYCDSRKLDSQSKMDVFGSKMVVTYQLGSLYGIIEYDIRERERERGSFLLVPDKLSRSHPLSHCL